MMNSPCGPIVVHGEGEVIIHWILNVHVADSIGQDIPAANVTATYPNATLAESKLTDTEGKAKMTMMEKMINATGEYPVGNYTVMATYDIYSDETEVNMTENRQVNLTLTDFVIPEFPSILIIPLFIIATSLVAFGYQKRREINTQVP